MRGLVTPRKPFRLLEPAAVEHYPKGFKPNPERPLRPGDFILTHGLDWASGLIRIGQGLRFHGSDAKYAYWNHAALLVNEDLDLIEALANGVDLTNLRKYFGTDYHLVRIRADDEDREEVVTYAQSCVGARYGYLTIVSLFFTCLVGAKFSFAIDGEHICSGLVARAQERTHAIFNRDPEHIMPADLAKYYGVDTAVAKVPEDRVPAVLNQSDDKESEHSARIVT